MAHGDMQDKLSMEKSWFIFEGDHHLGPFSLEEIVEMYQEDRVSQDVMVWKAGNKSWLPISQCPAFSDYIQEKADNHSEIINYKQIFDIDEINQNDEIPPEVPTDSENKNVDSMEEVEFVSNSELNSIEEDKTEVEIEKEEVISHDDEVPTSQEYPSDAYYQDKESIKGFIDESISQNQSELANEKILVTETDIKKFEEVKNLYRPIFSRDYSELKHAAWQKGLVSGLVILMLAVGIYFLLPEEENYNFSNELRLPDIQIFEKIMRQEERKGTKIALALSNNGHDIWIASNRKNSALVYLTLKSIDGKILSTERIVAESKSKLINGVAKFNNFKMVNGNNLVHGHYKVELFGINVGMKAKFHRLLKSINLLKDVTTRFTHNGSFIIANRPISKFEQKLKNYHKTIISKQIQPIRDMLEKYKTFNTFLDKLESNYQGSLDAIDKGVLIQGFEQYYSQSIAPILQGVILDNDKIHISLLNVQPQLAAEYKELFLFGRQIGVLVSDFVDKTKKIQVLKQDIKTRLFLEFQESATILREMGNIRIKRLQQKLLLLQNSFK